MRRLTGREGDPKDLGGDSKDLGGLGEGGSKDLGGLGGGDSKDLREDSETRCLCLDF